MGIWRVLPHSDGRWQVVTPGGTRACARTETQHAASEKAQQLAGNEGGGDIIVHHPDGHEHHRFTAPR